MTLVSHFYIINLNVASRRIIGNITKSHLSCQNMSWVPSRLFLQPVPMRYLPTKLNTLSLLNRYFLTNCRLSSAELSIVPTDSTFRVIFQNDWSCIIQSFPAPSVSRHSAPSETDHPTVSWICHHFLVCFSYKSHSVH